MPLPDYIRKVGTSLTSGVSGVAKKVSTAKPLVSGTYIPNSETSRAVPPILTGSFVGGGGTAFNTKPPSTTASAGYATPQVPAGYTIPNIWGKEDTSLEDALKGLLALAGNQPIPAVGQITAPQIPQTDISGLLDQYSPKVSQAFDSLIRNLSQNKAAQQKSFGDTISKLQASYAGPAGDVAAGTQQAQQNLQALANQFNLQPALGGQFNQRWAETAGRLSNLAQQGQAAQMGTLNTLANARNSMYDTFTSSAKGAQATALAELANRIATGQSNIDTARMQAQGQLSGQALGAQTDLAKTAMSLSGQGINQQMDILRMLAQLQGQRESNALDRAKLSASMAQDAAALKAANNPFSQDYTAKDEMTQLNPGLYESIQAIPNPTVRNLVNEAWTTTPSIDEAFRQISGLTFRTPEELEAQGVSPMEAIAQYISNAGSRGGLTTQERTDINSALEFLRPRTTMYGGTGTKRTANQQGQFKTP